MSFAVRCHTCGVPEGFLHHFGCQQECCPWCPGLLISCRCLYTKMQVYDPARYGAETKHLAPAVHAQGLDAYPDEAWLRLFRTSGRIPFIDYPLLCIRCGTLSPQLFMVPTRDWQRYVQPDKREALLCIPCYREIKRLIDTAQEDQLVLVGPPRERPSEETRDSQRPQG